MPFFIVIDESISQKTHIQATVTKYIFPAGAHNVLT